MTSYELQQMKNRYKQKRSKLKSEIKYLRECLLETVNEVVKLRKRCKTQQTD